MELSILYKMFKICFSIIIAEIKEIYIQTKFAYVIRLMCF